MISYKAILEYFDVICERHQNINQFTHGELDQYDKDKYTKYPALHIMPTATSIDEQVVVYGFDLTIYTRYNHNSNQMRNQSGALSDTLLLLQDVCKELTEGKFFITPDTNIHLSIPVVAIPILDDEPDHCSGWTTSFEITTPNEASADLIPYYSSEIWSNKNVKLPDGVPNISVWFGMMDLANNLTLSGDMVSTLSPFLDGYGLTDELSRVGNGVSFDYLKQAILIDTQTENSDCYLSQLTKTLDGDRWTFFIKIKDFKAHPNASSVIRNYLFSLYGNGTEIGVIIDRVTGELLFENVVETGNSLFPIVDTDKTRKEPLVIALRIDASAIDMECFYSSDSPIRIKTAGISIDGFSFRIGSQAVLGKASTFYLSDFFYTKNVLSDSEIQSTREWLKYR